MSSLRQVSPLALGAGSSFLQGSSHCCCQLAGDGLQLLLRVQDDAKDMLDHLQLQAVTCPAT